VVCVCVYICAPTHPPTHTHTHTHTLTHTLSLTHTHRADSLVADGLVDTQRKATQAAEAILARHTTKILKRTLESGFIYSTY
jgi:hypothetical protein